MQGAAGGHGVAKPELPFRRQAEGAAGAQVVEQRLFRRFGHLVGVEADVEMRMGIAPFSRAEGGIVVQRIDARLQHVGVLEQIVGDRKKRIRIAPFEGPPIAIVVQRVNPGAANIRIGLEVERGVEIAGIDRRQHLLVLIGRQDCLQPRASR